MRRRSAGHGDAVLVQADRRRRRNRGAGGRCGGRLERRLVNAGLVDHHVGGSRRWLPSIRSARLALRQVPLAPSARLGRLAPPARGTGRGHSRASSSSSASFHLDRYSLQNLPVKQDNCPYYQNMRKGRYGHRKNAAPACGPDKKGGRLLQRVPEAAR